MEEGSYFKRPQPKTSFNIWDLKKKKKTTDTYKSVI